MSVCFLPSVLFSILLILWLHHQVPVKSGMKGYKNKTPVYALEDSGTALTQDIVVLTTKHPAGFRTQHINSTKYKHYED